MSEPETKMPFLEHLEELRFRILWCLAAIAVGFVVCWIFKEPIFRVFTFPLLDALPQGERIIFTGLPEAFFTYLKLSFLGGVVIAVPVIIYHAWGFLAPGLYEKEKKAFVFIIFSSSIFFVAGSLFGYFVVFPYGFRFFLSFSGDVLRALPTMREYLSLASRLLIGFGLVFELPVVVYFLARLGIVSAAMMRRYRAAAIVIIFTLAALLTPPDPVTQLMMAGPLWLLYEVSVLVAATVGPKVTAEEEEEEPGDDTAGDHTAP